MASVNSKALVDEIIQNNGYYADDTRVFAIHKYTTQWGGECYHLAYSPREVNRIHMPDCLGITVIDPILIWDHSGDKR